MTICSRCVLSDNIPGIEIKDGLCNYCADESASLEAIRQAKQVLKSRIDSVLREKRNTLSDYDCVVAYSGGKDSTYTLKMLTEEYGLRCLALTIDNGFVSEQAMRNCMVVTDELGVDLMWYKPKPQFMQNMYVESMKRTDIHPRSSIKRASNICNSCISLINNHVIKTALNHNISVIAGGYIGGQVPKDSAVLEIDLGRQAQFREASMSNYIRSFGDDARQYFGLGKNKASDAKLTVLNPMLAVDITEEEIIAAIEVLGWKRTQDTGRNSSNCRLNDVGIAVHHQQHGFHPYVFEIAEQVRAGQMSRDEALSKIESIPAAEDLVPQFSQLGMSPSDVIATDS